MSDDVLSVRVHGREAGLLIREGRSTYSFAYHVDYDGPPVSLTMPVREEPYRFDRFPPYFDGLLPEGWQLEALLRRAKLERSDYMGHLRLVGQDAVGAVTVSASKDHDD